MTPLLFIGVALAGGLGSSCRLILDGFIREHTRGAAPWGTIIINLTGSFLLGLVTGLAGAHLLDGYGQIVLGTGFLGGFTTFSTASFETVRLLQQKKWVVGGLNGVGVLVGTTLLAGLGLWIGGLGG